MADVRPPLKWAGGKRWQVLHIRPLWELQSWRRLVEPFCGGLAITLGLRPERALLNDVNPHLINFYRWLWRGFVIEMPLENDADEFYRCRDRFNTLVAVGEDDGPEAAALFYYLNRTGYNGLCRFNRAGAFNVPFGRYRRIRYTRDFTPYRHVFAAWTFTCGDFTRVALHDEDFVYADPPYDVPFTHYAPQGFGWHDQQRTVEWLATHRGPVVLVNQATERIVRLYRTCGYAVRFLSAPRRITCRPDRTPTIEILATRNL